VGISATVKAEGTVEVVQAVQAVAAGDSRRAGEVMWVFVVARVDETGRAEVLMGAVEEVEAVGARGTGAAIEVGDAVDAGDIASAGKVVMGGGAGATKYNIVTATAATILAATQHLHCL